VLAVDGTVRRMQTVDDAARMALGLPQVTEAERHDNHTWSVAGRVFAGQRPFSKTDIRTRGGR
jgi:hypothetical protein